MKKTITFLLLFVALVSAHAQTPIPMTNGDCSTDATFTVSGTSSQTISGYTIAQTSPAALNLTTSGISSGSMKIFGTTNSTTNNHLSITTDKVDISTYPVDATFTFQCKLTCGTATSANQPYNVTIIAYAADGTTVISSGATSNVLTLTKVQPNTNVNAGVAQTVGATAVMKANIDAIVGNAKYIAFQLQMAKMITNNLTFDDFTLSNLSAPPTTIVGTPSNASLSYEVGNGPSSESTFTVSGTDLSTNNVTLTPGTNIEISLESGLGGTWVANPSTIALTPTAGTLLSTTIYTRLKSGINGLGAVGASSARITVFHSTAGTKTVQFTGNINGLTISNPVSSAIGYIAGNGHSTEQTFNVSGSGLTTDLVVTPGENMEISTSTGTGFASSPIKLIQAGGNDSFNSHICPFNCRSGSFYL